MLTRLLPHRSALVALWLVGLALNGAAAARAQAPAPTAADVAEAEAAPTSAISPAEQLRIDQEQLAARYRHFEEVMLRMAELTAGSDPQRAALLRRAVARSKENLISGQFEELVKLVGEDRLATAQSQQGELQGDLAELLELLLSEERSKRLKDEQASVKEQIRRLKELINKQLELQGRTATESPADELADGQQRLAGETGDLAQEMKPAGDEADEAATPAQGTPDEERSPQEPAGDDKQPSGASGESKPGESKPGEGDEQREPGDADKPGDDAARDDKPKDDQPKDDQQPGDEKPADSQSGGADSQEPKEPGDMPPGGQSQDSPQPGEPSDAPSGQPQQGQPQQGQPQDGEPQGGQQQSPGEQQPADAAQQHVERARQRMEQAEKKLREAERKGAVEEQEQAIRELEQAKAELEEILRQLREEEMERLLAMLEERFREMLQMQREVYEGTQRLDRVPAAERDRDHTIEAGRLSRRESAIVIEAEKALNVLREEGTAVAFPEAVEQMIDDMNHVVVQLGKAEVGRLTQVIEEDIIAALEEMIAALQQAQQDLEQQQQQPMDQPMSPEDMALIDQLAELRMIRSLQMRVNRRTQQLSELLDDGVEQALEPDLIEQLQELSGRQDSIHRATRDIVLGRNR